MPTILNGGMAASLRLEDSQLAELSAQAKKAPNFQGYLSKLDTGGKSSKKAAASKKWCLLHRNFLFYYDIETSSRPTGVLLVESCTVGSVAVVDTLLPDCFPQDREGGFFISTDSLKQHIFIAESRSERDKWITAIRRSSMFKVQQELGELQQKYDLLRSQFTSTSRELQFLKRQHFESQENIAHLRASLIVPRRSVSISSSPRTPTPELNSSDQEEESARILQSHIRGWLIRRRWKQVVHAYTNSSHAELMKKRNQLIWKLVESEQNYVKQLVILTSEFQNQFNIAAASNKPPLTMDQSVNIFRNCNELLLFHQLFLRGLSNQVDKWPVVILGDVLKLFFPMLSIYHQYIGNHTHAFEVLFDLKFQPKFKEFLEKIESRHTCDGHRFEELLVSPLKRITCYIQDIQELKSHTPIEHVDYAALSEMGTELELIHKGVTDEVSYSENIRNVLKIESKIEGGCPVLLDKEQALVRKGILCIWRQDDKLLTFSRKTRRRQNYCFLFSKHFLVTQRVEKKGEEGYRLLKENGLLSLAKCRIHEHALPEYPELRFLSFGLEIDDGSQSQSKQKLIFIAMSVAEKAQWIADIAQCIENEKQNKILQSQSQGEPVELNSKFMRYSTFRSGKEQLVSCGNLDSLLLRLTKVSYFGLDFLNTFLTTFPLFTTPQNVLDYLIKSYHHCMEEKAKKSMSLSLPPEDCTRHSKHLVTPVHVSASNRTTLPGNNPRLSPLPTCSYSGNASNKGKVNGGSSSDSGSVSGIFFALKHWICKHFYHFRDCKSLDVKLQELLDTACHEPTLTSSEKRVIMEVSQLYMMQKNDHSEPVAVLQYLSQEREQLSSYEIVLTWQPRQVAEQLCHIDSILFCQIENDELLRHLTYKGQDKKEVSPNLVRIIQYFNKVRK
ncbi:PREDICTED: ras-specific guanine nucleotide-releasing factor 1-like [Amphimedon queenslandica]|uniref:PH domain-containing protein n=1 Tax=Amphimedon queenslandica TaxID=400682 RepID=A0AAN0J8H4_AMPQE|nr:PREDICTED: ras-specific guanine nucleotide-releasing factor 1-like [Amphimedon queenslandica]|eukprot:XP_019853320.1 PREDICTED: ras-specific guanine nucleotide-releasing factor 1-like [Amphimedon queenslandica]